MKTSELSQKFEQLGMNPEMAMAGLANLKPINYWEYVQLDTLLTLQNPRTDFEDEYIFIVYHQITELVFTLMLHELKQIYTGPEESEFLTEKIYRLSNYTRMLTNSFGIMSKGMDYDQYNTFRHSLSPASGFQSAQYREIELYCTNLANLAKSSAPTTDVREMFNHIYWQKAGLDHATGEKTLTLRQFENKYLGHFVATAQKLNGNTLESKLNRLQQTGKLSEKAKSAAREFDNLYNIKWPLVHLNTAEFYLNTRGAKKEATGGSDWQKYLHPKYQKRSFFPQLWSAEEMATWGENG